MCFKLDICAIISVFSGTCSVFDRFDLHKKGYNIIQEHM